MDRTYLITGGAGNLACQLTHPLAQRGGRVVLFDLAEQPVAETAHACRYVQGDVVDEAAIDRVLAEHRPQVLMHFASLLSGSSEADRGRAWAVNLDAAFTLLESALRHGVRQVLFPSSVATYGGELPEAVPEDHPQWPIGLYGVTKLAVERLGAYYHARHGIDFRAIRLPAIVSAFAPPGAVSAYVSRAFVEAVQYGRFTFKVPRDACPSMLYIKDALRAILMLSDAPREQLRRRVYNIESLSPTAEEIARAVTRWLPQAEMVFDPDPGVTALVRSWPISFDAAAARDDWAWQPRYDLAALAEDFIKELQV